MNIDENDTGIEDTSEQTTRTDREKQQNRIDWRRSKVMELYMSGETNHFRISQKLHVSRSVVTKDLQFILAQSRDEIHNVIQDKLPLLYKKTDELLNFITSEALRIYANANTDMQKIAALNLAKETASQQFELSTNSTILSDAMHFVESHSQTLDNITKALAERDKKQKEQQEQDKPEVEEEIVDNELSPELSESQEGN